MGCSWGAGAGKCGGRWEGCKQGYKAVGCNTAFLHWTVSGHWLHRGRKEERRRGGPRCEAARRVGRAAPGKQNGFEGGGEGGAEQGRGAGLGLRKPHLQSKGRNLKVKRG